MATTPRWLNCEANSVSLPDRSSSATFTLLIALVRACETAREVHRRASRTHLERPSHLVREGSAPDGLAALARPCRVARLDHEALDVAAGRKGKAQRAGMERTRWPAQRGRGGAPVEEAAVVLAARAQRQEVLREMSAKLSAVARRGLSRERRGWAHLCCFGDRLAKDLDLRVREGSVGEQRVTRASGRTLISPCEVWRVTDCSSVRESRGQRRRTRAVRWAGS